MVTSKATVILLETEEYKMEYYENEETFDRLQYLETELQNLKALELERAAYKGNWIPKDLFISIQNAKNVIAQINGNYL